VLPEQRKDTAALLRKAAITVTPQQVDASSPAVTALVGDVAAYVKPAPRAAAPVRGQSQGGRSQGANAQRKRAGQGGAAREGGNRDGQPRADRSGRPAQAAGSGRSQQPKRSGQGAASGNGAARSGGTSNGAARSGTLKVGGLVGMSQSSNGRRRGR
jgi:hypothetical protein